MPHRPIVILIALIFAIGVPMVYVVLKKRAASSLRTLLSDRFVERPCPVIEVAIPSGGHVRLHQAYNDTLGSGFVLVLGNWVRGTVPASGVPAPVYNKVAGLFKAGDDSAWLAQVRGNADIIVATQIEGGTLAIWRGLPSRDSVLAHFKAVLANEEQGAPSSVPVPPPSQATTADGPKSMSKSMTNLDAFQIPLICHDLGFSVAALAMLDSLGKLQGPLAAPVARYMAYYQKWGPNMAQQIFEVEGRLGKNGLTVPPRWSNVGQYAEWSLAIVNSVKHATEGQTGSNALVTLGHTLGLLTRSSALYFVILRLAVNDPQHEAVRYRQGRRREDCLRFVTEFLAAANQPAIPIEVRPHATSLIQAARSVQAIAESPSPGGPADLAQSLENIHKELAAHTQAMLRALEGEDTKARVTPLDALMIPLMCTDIGIPISALKLLSTLGTVEGPLAVRVARYQNMYHQKGDPFVAQQILDVEGRLSKHGLAVPPRPKTFEEYAEWYPAIVMTVTGAIAPGSSEGPLVFLGDRLGQFMLTLALHIAFLDLRATDPRHEQLRSNEEWSRRRFYEQVKQVVAVAELATFTSSAQPYALELANQVRMAQMVDEVPDPGGLAQQACRLEVIQEELFATTFALRAALGDRSPVVLNPTGFF